MASRWASTGLDGAWLQTDAAFTARDVVGVGYHLSLDGLAHEAMVAMGILDDAPQPAANPGAALAAYRQTMLGDGRHDHG